MSRSSTSMTDSGARQAPKVPGVAVAATAIAGMLCMVLPAAGASATVTIGDGATGEVETTSEQTAATAAATAAANADTAAATTTGATTAIDPLQADGAYVVFNYPDGDTPDLAIEQHLISLAEQTPAGAQIHGAMFTWTRAGVAQAMADAQTRGVSVNLAVDAEGDGGWNNNPDNAALPILRGAGFDDLVWCRTPAGDGTGCISNRADSIQHAKLFTFSQVGDMEHVVWLASHNLTNAQNLNFNNSLVWHGDEELYEFFTEYIQLMLSGHRDNDFFNSPDGRYSSTAIDAFLSPRATSSGGMEPPEAATDTIVQLLRGVQEHEEGCGVDLAHAQFTGPRVAVAEELIRIGQLGCRVRIIAGSNVTDYIRDQLAGQTNIQIRDQPAIHSKYIVVRGEYDGESDQHVVFTGSQNLTNPGLRRGDETLVRVGDAEIGAAYQANFDQVWQRSG